ncbi:MAG: DNA topoisomerase, partial [Chloroflexota bacterium]
MEAYCFKCKAKREIQNPAAGFNAKGGPVTTGVCGVCGTKLYRMGNTEAHAGLEKPVIERTASTASRNGAKPAKAVKRAGKLVIVESPAKAKTVQRFLGRGYQVRASVGHIRDLLRSQLSVDVENDFAPKYRVPNEKRTVVKEIKNQAATAQEVYLATDPDREGEAISWHLLEAAEIDPQIVKRVVFHEITQPAIAEAFAHPREIDMRLVNAQQARRILDRLVGYSLSPLLWAKVRGRLSAGRVQSVAVRLIVDREREIEAFVPQEYWTVEAELAKHDHHSKKQSFFARLLRVNDKEVGLDKDLPLPNEGSVQPILADLEEATWAV